MRDELRSGSAGEARLRKAGNRDTRRHNLGLILQTLSEESDLSRADIGRRTLLTKVAVSDLVSELMDSGLVEELGQRPGVGRGKPATALRIAAGSRVVVVLDLADPVRPRGGLVDLSGTLIRSEVRDFEHASLTPEDVARFASDLAAASSVTVLGVGIGTPGAIRPGGIITAAPRLGWQEVPLGALVAQATGLPVDVRNDADCAVLAERRYGGASPDTVLVRIATGLGAGILVGDSLVSGASGLAGEVGHVVVEDDGLPCPCGKRGCLECYVSVPALGRGVQAGGGGRVSDAELDLAAGRLARVLSPVVAMLDLSEVVVAGPENIVSTRLTTSLHHRVTAALETRFRPETVVRASRLGSDAVLLGAAALVIRERLGVR